MSVPFGHAHGRVPEQVLDDDEWNAALDEVARECVAQHVPRMRSDGCVAAQLLDMERRSFLNEVTAALHEDKWSDTGEVVQCGGEGIGERDEADDSVLRPTESAA